MVVVVVKIGLYGYLSSELEGNRRIAFVHVLPTLDSVNEVVKPCTESMPVPLSGTEVLTEASLPFRAAAKQTKARALSATVMGFMLLCAEVQLRLKVAV